MLKALKWSLVAAVIFGVIVVIADPNPSGRPVLERLPRAIGPVWLITFLLAALVVYVIGVFSGRQARGSLKVCAACGSETDRPKIAVKGSTLVELVLWLMLIVPGLIYSFWRLASKHPACPTCGSASLIPADSPAARSKSTRFAATQPDALPAAAVVLDMRRCPACDELIRPAAIKCKHCGSAVEPLTT